MNRFACLGVLAFAGCFITPAHDPVPLSSLTRTSVTVQTVNDARTIDPESPRSPAVSVRLDTRQLGSNGDARDCPTIRSNTTATFDGLAMSLVDAGGWDAPIDGSSLCHVIAFSLADAPARPGATSTLAIADDSTPWTIEGGDLLTNDFALASAPAGGSAAIRWASADAIAQAYVQFTTANGTVLFDGASSIGDGDISIAGNLVTITFSAANVSGTLAINASRMPAATRCDGPASCTLELALGADLPARIP